MVAILTLGLQIHIHSLFGLLGRGNSIIDGRSRLGKGLTVSVVHLLVPFKVATVEQHLLIVVQIIFEKLLLVDSVDALLVQLGIVADVLALGGRLHLLLLWLHILINFKFSLYY